MHLLTPPKTSTQHASLFTNPTFMIVVFLMLYLLFPHFAHASSTGMPWESPVQKIVDSITGPIAFAISVLAIVGSIAQLIWGGEMSGLIQKLLYLAMGIAVIVFATNMLRSLFNVSSTLVS